MKKTWRTLWCKDCRAYEEHWLLYDRKRQHFHMKIYVCRVCESKLEVRVFPKPSEEE